jgi:hypothetical protein
MRRRAQSGKRGAEEVLAAGDEANDGKQLLAVLSTGGGAQIR